jgi:hypothetical protein
MKLHVNYCAVAKTIPGPRRKWTSRQCRDYCEKKPKCFGVDYAGSLSMCWQHLSPITWRRKTDGRWLKKYKTIAQYEKKKSCIGKKHLKSRWPPHPFCLHRQSAYVCSDSAPDPNLLRGVKLWIPRTDWLPSLFTWSYVVIEPRDYHGNHALCLEAFWLVTCQVAAKIWIQIFQTSLACRNNHRRNGVRPRK